MSERYQEIPWKLEGLQTFTGNSMSARGDADGAGYSVYSYATEIARVIRHPETGSFVALVTKPGTYSPTTSRQQNLCRAHLPGEHRDVAAPKTGACIALPDDLRASDGQIAADAAMERVNAATSN